MRSPKTDISETDSARIHSVRAQVVRLRQRSRPDRMNHKRFCIVLLAGHRDDGVTPLMFSNHRGE